MGLFDKLFRRAAPSSADDAPPDPASDDAEEPAPPDAAIVLRHGMNLPAPSYIAEVLAAAFPAGLPAGCHREGLAQPSWFKNAETTESGAADVAHAFGRKLQLPDARHSFRVVLGPDGAKVLLVELRRA